MSVRGDVTVDLGGAKVRLLLDLAAMERIEDKLKADNIFEAVQMAQRGKTRAIRTIVEETALAGGVKFDGARLDFTEAVAAVKTLMDASFPDDDDDGDGDAPGADAPAKN